MRRSRHLALALVLGSCTPGAAPTSPPPSPAERVPDAPEVWIDAGAVAAADAGVATPAPPTIDAQAGVAVAAPTHLERPDASARGAAVSGHLADAGPGASGPAREGEMCARHPGMPQPMMEPPLQRACAPGLVCCVPPHGAVMQVETAYCRVPCKPTPPSPQYSTAGCSSNGCPWAAVP